MPKLKLSLSFILALLIGFQLSAQGIKSSTQGFSVNLNGAYGTWDSESLFLRDLANLEPTGLGVSVKAGYGINQNIEVLLGISSVGFQSEFEWNSYSLTNVQIGGRYNFGATLRQFRPFLEAAISLNSLNVDPITVGGGTELFELESSGVGGSAGGGLHFFILPQLSANANGRIMFGGFSSTSLSGTEMNNFDEKLDFTITTIHIGLTYFFE